MSDDEYLPSPVCEYCIHYYHQFDYTCTAYPDGIPGEIWLGEHLHTTPFEGDHGIQFALAVGDRHKPSWMNEEE